jgi:hypothetical protein
MAGEVRNSRTKIIREPPTKQEQLQSQQKRCRQQKQERQQSRDGGKCRGRILQHRQQNHELGMLAAEAIKEINVKAFAKITQICQILKIV